jgi:phosphoenolpyruvate synthase/pyruvate phosphate dikinase
MIDQIAYAARMPERGETVIGDRFAQGFGGKGANLAEMCLIGLPVPAGFTVTTECCVDYFKAGGKNPASLAAEVKTALKKVEKDIKNLYYRQFLAKIKTFTET